MTKALVTGGSGFLGSHIADVLTAKGFAVTVFDRQPSPYLQLDQKMVIGDICNIGEVEKVMNNCEYVFHLAALADLNAARSRPVETALLNILGTVNLLEASRKAGAKRFIFASTVYVYSREGGFYRCSKQACESYIEEYQRQYGLDYTILRYGSLYGPRADENNGVYKLLVQALNNGRIKYQGTPDDIREYIHVADAARMTVEALSDEYSNQHLVLAGQQQMRLPDLFTMFSEILGRSLDVEYIQPEESLKGKHYRVTPYTFNPKAGRKLTSNCYVDMGQGIIEWLDHIYARKTEAVGL